MCMASRLRTVPGLTLRARASLAKLLARKAELIVERAARWADERQLVGGRPDESELERTGWEG